MHNSRKALLVTTVSGFVPQFEMNNVRLLQSMGYDVHYAANYNTPSYGNDNHRLDGTGIVRHQIDFVRSPFKAANLNVYRQLCSLMRSEHFDLVHCHTPWAALWRAWRPMQPAQDLSSTLHTVFTFSKVQPGKLALLLSHGTLSFPLH